MRRCMSCMQEYEEQLSECPHCGYCLEKQEQQKTDCPDVLPPETILLGRYILGRLHKTDGFFNTYITWDALLEKKVLVKEYFPAVCATRIGQEKELSLPEHSGINRFEYGRIAFEEESDRLIRNQDLDGIVPAFRCFRERGTTYRVSEFVLYDTVEDVLSGGEKILIENIDHLLIDLCEIVDQMHSRGIFHMDLSLKCIYVDEEWNGRLTDFGYAKSQLLKLLPEDVSLVSEYMAPEILHGDEAGGSADIFSLGVVAKKLYQCVEDIPFRKRTRIRKALNQASNMNPKKRPVSAEELLEMIFSY